MAMRTRSEVIAHLTQLLSDECGDLVEEVYPYIPTNPQGISPFISIVSAGTGKPSKRQTSYFVNVYWFVIAASSQRSVTIQDSWATMDTLSEDVINALERLSSAQGYWHSLIQTEATVIDTIVVENQGYLIEVCPLRIDVY